MVRRAKFKDIQEHIALDLAVVVPIFDFENVEMVIYQPRLTGASSYKITLQKLRHY